MTWTRIHNGFYRSGSITVERVEGGWQVAVSGKAWRQTYPTAAAAKERAASWLASR